MFTEKDFPILTTQMKNINTYGLSFRAYRAIISTSHPSDKSVIPLPNNTDDLMSLLTTIQPKDITNQHSIGKKTLKEIHTWIHKQLSP